MSDRTVDTYLYVPITAVAIIVGVIALSPRGEQAVAALLLLWLPWNYLHSRSGRQYEVAAAAENRAYVSEARRFVAKHPNADTLIVAGWPKALASWGARGIFRLLYDTPPVVHDSDEGALHHVMQNAALVAEWHPRSQLLQVGTSESLSYLEMKDPRTIFQLGDGWGQAADFARWFDSDANAVIYPSAGEFVCTLRLVKMAKTMPVTIRVLLSGRVLGVVQFRATGTQSAQWRVSGIGDRAVPVEFSVEGDPSGPIAQALSFGFAGKISDY
jgi:hypothetical protein